MEPKTINLQELSLESLKAMAYDTLAAIEFHQKNLQTLNIEINNRNQEVKKNV